MATTEGKNESESASIDRVRRPGAISEDVRAEYRLMPRRNIGRYLGVISDDTSAEYRRGTSKRSAELDVDKTVFSRIPDNLRCLFVVLLLLLFGRLVVGVVVWLLSVGCSLLVVVCWLSVGCCLFFVFCCLLFFGGCFFCCLLVGCLLSVGVLLLFFGRC